MISTDEDVSTLIISTHVELRQGGLQPRGYYRKGIQLEDVTHKVII